MSKQVSQAYDAAKNTAADATRSIKKELEDKPLFAVPVKISNDFNIEDLEKPTALYLFREDYNHDNKLAFNGKFKGRWTVKLNAALQVEGSCNEPKLAIVDDAQLNGHLGSNALQLKFKPAKVSAQLDFGHHAIHSHTHGKGYEVVNQSFLNPYLYFDTSRDLKENTYAAGFMFYFDTWLRTNSRLNLRRKEGKIDWDIQENALFRHKGFFANYHFGYNFTDAIQFRARKFLLGYDKNEVNVNLELGVAKGSWREWKLDSSTASLSYDFRERGLFGLIAELNPAKAELPKSEDISLGYRNKLRKDVELKTKLSYKGLAALFLGFHLKDGVNLHTSVSTNIINKDKKGFLEMPFDFGLKLKIEQ